MKFELKRPYYSDPDEILAEYPELAKFNIEILPVKFGTALYIEIADLGDLAKLLNTISTPNGFIIEQNEKVGSQNPTYTMWIYDDYME